MTSYQFQTMEKGEDYPKHNSFLDAWNDMYEYVNNLIKSNSLSYQVLENAIWIEISNQAGQSPIMFYDSRDRAIKNGWKQKSRVFEVHEGNY